MKNGLIEQANNLLNVIRKIFLYSFSKNSNSSVAWQRPEFLVCIVLSSEYITN